MSCLRCCGRSAADGGASSSAASAGLARCLLPPWCLKESVDQALGVGVGADVDHLRSRCGAGGAARRPGDVDTRPRLVIEGDGRLPTDDARAPRVLHDVGDRGQWHFEASYLDPHHCVAVGTFGEASDVQAPRFSVVDMDAVVAAAAPYRASPATAAELDDAWASYARERAPPSTEQVM